MINLSSSQVLIDVFLVGMSLQILLVNQNFHTLLYHTHARGETVFGQIDHLENHKVLVSCEPKLLNQRESK